MRPLTILQCKTTYLQAWLKGDIRSVTQFFLTYIHITHHQGISDKGSDNEIQVQKSAHSRVTH